jgi:hypothetical protein
MLVHGCRFQQRIHRLLQLLHPPELSIHLRYQHRLLWMPLMQHFRSKELAVLHSHQSEQSQLYPA